MSVQERQSAAERPARGAAANEAFIKQHYSGEKFISSTEQLQAANKHTKGLVIPEGVKIAESRIPINKEQREILRKELRQAGILAKLGNSVCLIPERIGYKIRPKDAVVNGALFEFREITGKARTLEWEFGEAKKKGNDTNVFISIESSISKHEAWRRIVMVLERHPEYTGKIVVSFNAGEKIYFWDT